VQYILDDYRPGTLEWAEFERYFHRLMTRAKELAPARYLLLYPQLPFKGTPPLQAIYDHVRALSQPHRLAIPPAAWYRSGGVPVDRAEAPWHQAVQVKAGTRGTVIETRDYYLPPGDVDVMVTANAAAAGTLGTLAAVDAVSNEVIASAPLSFGDGGHRWQDVPARVTLPAPGRAIRFRIISAAAADFELGAISVAVDYAFKVIDLSDALNRFDTHASIFDSHPNAQAHKVIAEQVFDALTRAEPRR
jgi:hypothetical protein